MQDKLEKQLSQKLYHFDYEDVPDIISFIDQNFIGKEEVREKIEKIKFEEIDNGDSGIKYPTAKKSNPDALMQYAYNEAIKNILELIKISKEV